MHENHCSTCNHGCMPVIAVILSVTVSLLILSLMHSVHTPSVVPVPFLVDMRIPILFYSTHAHYQLFSLVSHVL